MGREEEVVYDPPRRRKARAPLEEQKLYCPESHTAQRDRPIRGLGNERRELRKRKTFPKDRIMLRFHKEAKTRDAIFF